MDTIHEEDSRGANPQAEQGHVDIANEIAEALARINFSAYESRILWVIWRQTYGWHKKMDQISVTQFQKKTGLDRRNLARTLDRLVNRKIVVRIDNTFITTYGFQKDYSKWKTVVSAAGGLSEQTTRSVVNLDTHKRKTTKEKTLSVEKATDPRVKEFLKYWGEAFLQETGQPYVFSFGKDGNLAKKLLRVHRPEILQEATKSYFRDDQCKRQGFTFGRFWAEINGLLSRKAMDPLEQAKREIARGKP